MTAPELVTATIPGKPIAKGRPRLGRHGIYSPPSTHDAEERAGWLLRAACPVPLEGPLEVRVSFCFHYPRSWSKAKRDAVEDGAQPWHLGRPDLDNLLKLILDAANRVLWRDDAQVVKIAATKIYAAEAETIVGVYPAGGAA